MLPVRLSDVSFQHFFNILEGRPDVVSDSAKKSAKLRVEFNHRVLEARTLRAFLRLRIQNAGKRGIVGLLTVATFGCTIYRPQPLDDLNSLPQARTQSDGEVRIRAAVLTAEESKRSSPCRFTWARGANRTEMGR